MITFKFKIHIKKGTFPDDTHAKIIFFDEQEFDFDRESEKEMVFELPFEPGENKKDAAKVGNRAWDVIWRDKKVQWKRNIPLDEPERTWKEVWLSDDLPLFGAIHASTDVFGNVQELSLPKPMTVKPKEGLYPMEGGASVRVELWGNKFVYNLDLNYTDWIKTKVSLLSYVEEFRGAGNVYLYRNVWLPEELRIGEDRSRKEAYKRAFRMIVNTSGLKKVLAKAGWTCEIEQVNYNYVTIKCKGKNVPYTEMYACKHLQINRIESDDLRDQAVSLIETDNVMGEMHVLGEETGLFVAIKDGQADQDYSINDEVEKEFLKQPSRERYLQVLRYVTHSTVRE